MKEVRLPDWVEPAAVALAIVAVVVIVAVLRRADVLPGVMIK